MIFKGEKRLLCKEIEDWIGIIELNRIALEDNLNKFLAMPGGGLY